LTNLGLVKFAARHTFIIDPQGKIVKEFMDVKPSGHSAEVLAALAELRSKTSSNSKAGSPQA
jgi:peroxiredoxin Q/BCP